MGLVEAYGAMLPALAAEEQLRNIQAASVPHMEEADSRTVISKFRRIALSAEGDPPARQSMHQAMVAAGVQIEYVPKEVKDG